MPKILPILTFPAKSLQKPSVPVQEVTPWVQDLVADMFETMHQSRGIGLAAPQVGENINLLVMDVCQYDVIDPEKEIPNPICLINPKIISREGVLVFEEGCLSCPELLVEVERSQDVVVEALDVEGRLISHHFSDLESVCAQHEMDHLEGILLTDRISRLKREMYRKQMVRKMKEEEDV